MCQFQDEVEEGRTKIKGEPVKRKIYLTVLETFSNRQAKKKMIYFLADIERKKQEDRKIRWKLCK